MKKNVVDVLTLFTELKVNNDPDWARFYLGWGDDKTEFCVMKCCVFVILWYFLTDGDSMASDKNIKNNVFVSFHPSEYQIESHCRCFLIWLLLLFTY